MPKIGDVRVFGKQGITWYCERIEDELTLAALCCFARRWLSLR
jgi:hypothetical protein